MSRKWSNQEWINYEKLVQLELNAKKQKVADRVVENIKESIPSDKLKSVKPKTI